MIKELKLKEMIDKHINPEVLTFQKSYQLLIEEKDQNLVKIFVECFLLHARNLREFLKNIEKNDNVLISDYIKDNDDDKKVQNVKNIMKPMDEYRFRINKQLSHITWARLDGQEDFNQKKISEIYKVIIEAIKKFNHHSSKFKINIK